MKRNYSWILLIALTSVTIKGIGQIKPKPPEVTDAFNKMFPEARNVEWRDKIDNFSAFFNIKDAKCEAKFGKTGNWISTEEAIQEDSLPAAVRDGLKISKYADWREKASYILQLSGGVTRYHIVVTKIDSGQKVLVFDQNGQLSN
jgi:hypothetical protein